jgi:hypothetical protein
MGFDGCCGAKYKQQTLTMLDPVSMRLQSREPRLLAN